MDNGNKVNLFRMHCTIMIYHDEINYVSYIKIEGGMPALLLDCNSLGMTLKQLLIAIFALAYEVLKSIFVFRQQHHGPAYIPSAIS